MPQSEVPLLVRHAPDYGKGSKMCDNDIHTKLDPSREKMPHQAASRQSLLSVLISWHALPIMVLQGSVLELRVKRMARARRLRASP